MVAVALLAGVSWIGGRLPLAFAQAPQPQLPRAAVSPAGPAVAPLPKQLDNTQLLKALEPPPITPMVRTRALEIVDGDGKRRAWVSTDSGKNAIFGMMDAAGKLRVLLTVGPAAGLTILDRSENAQAELVQVGGTDRTLGTNTHLSLTQGAVVLDDSAGNHMLGMRLLGESTGDLWINSAPGTRHFSVESKMVGSGSTSTRIGELKLMAADGVAHAGFFTGAHIATVGAMGGVNHAGFEAGGERHAGFLRARTTVRGVQSEVLAIPTHLGGDLQDLLHVEAIPH
jgi:hypothetical protein